MPTVLVVGADAALFGLIEEWLATSGCRAVLEHSGLSPKRVDLVVVDVPAPRQNGLDSLRQISERWPNTPIVVLSSAFFTSIECDGAVARRLGVASVLPKPLIREALITAVRNLIPNPVLLKK